MAPQTTCAFALPGKTGKRENRIFLLKYCISALLEFNQSLLDFFSPFDSRLILTLLYDSLNLVINAFSSAPGCWGHGSGERKSREPQQLDCVARTMHVHQCAVFLKEQETHQEMRQRTWTFLRRHRTCRGQRLVLPKHSLNNRANRTSMVKDYQK